MNLYLHLSFHSISVDNYINFQSELTSDKIYGFGERSHDFKLNEGLYTIWPNEPAGIKYDKGFKRAELIKFEDKIKDEDETPLPKLKEEDKKEDSEFTELTIDDFLEEFKL